MSKAKIVYVNNESIVTIDYEKRTTQWSLKDPYGNAQDPNKVATKRNADCVVETKEDLTQLCDRLQFHTIAAD